MSISDISLQDYLEQQAISRLDKDIFKGFALAAVKFTVDQDGHIRNAHIAESSEHSKTDEVLLEAICNMPLWSPAVYKSGLKTSQDFLLTVGNMKNCKVNLYNIKKGRWY